MGLPVCTTLFTVTGADISGLPYSAFRLQNPEKENNNWNVIPMASFLKSYIYYSKVTIGEIRDFVLF